MGAHIPAFAELEPTNVVTNANDDAGVLHYRAVGLNEAVDIDRFGGFRPKPGADFQEGKWFAARYEDAVRWGRELQRIERARARSFRVAAVTVPSSFVGVLDYRPHHDAIGPAFFVHGDRLARMNAVGRIDVHDTIYAPGGGL